MQRFKNNRIIGLVDLVTFGFLLILLVVTVLIVVVFIASWFEGYSATINFSWPILFSEQLQNTFYSDNLGAFARPHDSDFGGLGQLSAELSPRTYDWPFFNSYTYLSTIVKFALVGGIVFLFRQIILDIKQQIPFSEKNCFRLKYMALLLFSFFLYALIDVMIIHWYIITHVEMQDIEFVSRILSSNVSAQSALQDHQVLLSNNRDFSVLVYALIVYVIALIFQEGLKLKQDNNAIV